MVAVTTILPNCAKLLAVILTILIFLASINDLGVLSLEISLRVGQK